MNQTENVGSKRIKRPTTDHWIRLPRWAKLGLLLYSSDVQSRCLPHPPIVSIATKKNNTLAPIIMEVENYPQWKETNSGATPIFHFNDYGRKGICWISLTKTAFTSLDPTYSCPFHDSKQRKISSALVSLSVEQYPHSLSSAIMS